METHDEASAGYPEEGPPGADPTDDEGGRESDVREKSRPDAGDAPDNDDGKATGNPNT